jgi:transcription-repair coupling factor (superfamily II helicase)
VRAASFRLNRGDELDRDELVASLVSAGYVRQPVVEERGEVAVRGGIVDVFPPHRPRPIRIELLGDDIESLREFDPASQRSQAELESLIAPPPREILGDRSLIVDRADQIRALGAELGVADRFVDPLVDTLLRGNIPPGAEAIGPLLQPAMETFFDFLPEDAPILLAEPSSGRDRMQHFAEEALEGYEALVAAKERVACTPGALLLLPEEIEARLEARSAIALERLEVVTRQSETHVVRTAVHDALVKSLREARGTEAPLAPLLSALRGWSEEGIRVVIAAAALSTGERARALLAESGFDVELVRDPGPTETWSTAGAVEVRLAELSEGFALRDDGLVVLTDQELFGPREKPRKVAGWRESAAIDALGQLSGGDFLVHAEHGIGIYRGLVLLEVGRFRDEFLRLEYEGGDRLFVPVHRLNLIQRYVGSEGAAPKIDKLGGVTWEKTKRGVRKSMRVMAKELLDVHATRELLPGTPFPGRGPALEAFEAEFPYEATPDQAKAVDDVIEDMVRPQPMDRLVCGDVGYGKTEVAARAAHQVLQAGKQVAILVPTTVLCQQHAETFVERFKSLPVRVESLSRFRSPKESREVLSGLADGSVDIVVGTHKLLQKSVAYRDLGMLVVDEEHRFGVAHKERIKQLKQTVDVLTLTATPIPRTLQMAFSGLRDLSVIETPPPDRLAIRTQVCRFDDSLVREAILREVRRGGQAFFVHNRVKTIYAMAEWLERTVPEVKILVAHGQMPERELEDRMVRFMKGEFDVLLCTTIIESGLDIPRANTILIDRADALGLAQLYQLRGRVGRSNRRAYAYLLIPGEAALTPDATRRLEALQDLTELGSGFRLANMDLEIRGAGNLVGGEQSGHLGAVGFDTYMELLEEAIEELRGGVRPLDIDPEIKLPIPARLPESYVSDVSQRLVLYKRLAGAPDPEVAEELRDELLDRFGPLPTESENLVDVIRLKIAARDLGIVKLELVGEEIVVTAAPTSRVDPALLVELVTGPRGEIRVMPDQRVCARIEGTTPAQLFGRAHWLLDQLAKPLH